MMAAKSLRNIAALAVLTAILGAGSVQANEALIPQLEQLRNGLAVKDEGRGELTLRLADLHFYAAVEKSKESDHSNDPAQMAKLAKKASEHRLRSLELYREGVAKVKESDLRTKIQFQMAQLLSGLGREGEAMPLWRSLAEQELQPKIRSEALMRLAQAAETAGSPKDRAQAEGYYRAALGACQAHDVCAFVRYRLAWLLKGNGKNDEAIAEIRKSLWDSRGGIQEEVLRDLLVFLTAKPGDGSEALGIVDELVQKLQRPELLQQLADNFYSAGNKEAAITVLRVVEGRKPSLANEVRLIEEYYGKRSWEEFRSMMSAAEKSVESGSTLDANGEKLLLRVVIQLDGERDTQKQYSADFQRVAMLYLSLFPKSATSFRIMESWLAAETDAEEKKAQIARWLAEEESTKRFGLDNAKKIRFHEVRLSMAQETKDHATVQAETKALVALYDAPAKKREMEYIYAKSLYETKQLGPALEGFRALAKPVPGAKADKFALLSQNLALDVLNQQKDYAGITAQANTWLKNNDLKADASQKGELQQMQEVADQADFERAVAMGTSADALGVFAGFCLAGKLLPKSCDNARTLAVQTGDRATLLSVLEKQGAKNDLVHELEAAAFFGRAAELRESQTPLAQAKWTGAEAIKIALLFELEGRFADRDRWLNALAARYRKAPIDIDEALLYQTLADSNLLNASMLTVRWSEPFKLRLAHQLELTGQGTKATRELLLGSKTEVGPLWSYYIEQELVARDERQRKINFYGKNSKANFQKRLASVQELDKFAAKYLDGATLETRIIFLTRLEAMYRDLVTEIQGAPLPEGIDAETKAQIDASLAEMAKPFAERAATYTELLKTQNERLADAAKRAELEAMLAKRSPGTAMPLVQPKPVATAQKKWDRPAMEAHVKALHKDPEAQAALTGLRDYFGGVEQGRLSSYFEGRIRSAQKGKL